MIVVCLLLCVVLCSSMFAVGLLLLFVVCCCVVSLFVGVACCRWRCSLSCVGVCCYCVLLLLFVGCCSLLCVKLVGAWLLFAGRCFVSCDVAIVCCCVYVVGCCCVVMCVVAYLLRVPLTYCAAGVALVFDGCWCWLLVWSLYGVCLLWFAVIV